MRHVLRPLLLLAGWLSLATPAAARPAHHFVLVHGSWHGAWCWYQVQAALERAGQAVTAVDLPAHGVDRTPPAQATLDAYADRVTAALDASHEPVILVGHSMGGIAISQAAEARPDRVAKLVYLAAFLLPDGSSIVDMSAADTGSLLNRSLRAVDRDGDGVAESLDFDRASAGDIFYAKSPRADVALSGLLLVPDPLRPLLTPLHLGASYDRVRRFYIRTAFDRAVSPALQETMYTRTPAEKVFTLKTDHSPFFSNPRKLTRILLAIAATR